MEKNYSLIFALLVCTNVIINLDHGIIPAATVQIEEDLHIGNSELGYLGSLVYLGIVVVGLGSGRIFLNFNAKWILQVSYIGMIVTLFLFTIRFQSNWPYFLLRFLTGGAQVFYTQSKAPMLIYFPVWIDHFGGEKKTLWLAVLTGVIPLGIFLGYVMSSLISFYFQWQITFYVQVIMLIPCFIAFSMVKNRDFDIKKQKNTVNDSETSLFDEAIQQLYVPNYWHLLKELLSQGVWVCITLTLSIMYFVVTGIQFWISNYFLTVLDVPQQKVNTVFSIVSITAPVLGCVAGGCIAHYYGGYDKPSSLPICWIYCLLGTACSIWVPYVDAFWLVTCLVWGLLFFGGALVPPLTGISMSSVSPKLRAFANSNTTTIINLLGYLPAPSVYGLLSNINDKAGLIFLMSYPALGIVLIGIAILIQKKKSEKEILIETN